MTDRPHPVEGQPASSATARRPRAQGIPVREVRRALWHILLAWVFGAAFCSITGGAPLNAFLTNYLKADDFSYGLVMAAGPAAVLFNMIGMLVIERTGRVKRNFLVFVTTGRLLWLAVAAIALWMPIHLGAFTRPQVFFCGLLAFASTGLMNFGGAGWATWMSDVVPTNVAGKFFGIRYQLGLFTMMLTGVGAAALIDRCQQTGWVYGVIFGLAACMGATDILLFLPVREVPRPVEAVSPSLGEILLTPWRSSSFRSFALYTAAAWIAYMMMGPLIARFCLDQPRMRGLGMNVSTMNLLVYILPQVGMALVAPCWGRAIDRFGPKPVLALSSLCAALIPLGWTVMHPALRWFIPLLVLLGGLTWPGIDQTILYWQIKGFPAERHTAYNATFLTVYGFAMMVGTAFGGWYASFWEGHQQLLVVFPSWVSHYHPVFLTSVLLRLAAFLFILPRLQISGSARLRTVAGAILRDCWRAIPGVMAVTRKRRRVALPAAKN